MSRPLASPVESPDANAALDEFVAGETIFSPTETASSQAHYEALMFEGDDDLPIRAAKEGLAGAFCPKGQVPLLTAASMSAAGEAAMSAQEAQARQALYSFEDRVYPRTNPNVTSFSVFDIPPSANSPDAIPASPLLGGADAFNALTQRVRRYNSLDEAQRSHSCQYWWKDGDRAAAEEMCPRIPTPPEVMAIPPLGFPKPFQDGGYKWNSRYLSILYSPDEKERSEAATAFIKDFTDEAVPILNFVLSNLTSLPATLLHCRGITIEVPGKAPYLEALFAGDHVAPFKVTGREYNARIAAQKEAVPQLVVPYTIMVELYGAKAIAYPRVPLPARPQGVGASSAGDGLAYGVRTDLRQFHNEFAFTNIDQEAESSARKLAKGLKAKAKYVGREMSSVVCCYTPTSFAVYRSPHDNRLYTGNLLHMFAPTVNTESCQCNDYFYQTFRPEFAEKHQTEPLSFESCTHLQVLGKEADEASRTDNFQLLMRYVIPQAAQQFSRDIRLWGVGWPLLEKGGLSRFLHSWGVNMRYLVEFRNAIRSGPKHNAARAFVEIEMVGRALKRSILKSCSLFNNSGIAYPHEISNHLKRIATGTVGSLWESEVWPAVSARYPAVAGENWASSRLDWKKCVERTLSLLGAQVRTTKGANSQATSRVVYAPQVHVPPFPKAPYGDGEVMNQSLRARRYLRSVVAGSVSDTAKQQALLCVQLLQNSQTEADCEEVTAYITAEAKRKEKKKPSADGAKDGERKPQSRTALHTISQLTMGTYAHFVSMRDANGQLFFDTSTEALGLFGFATQQRLQITMGPKKGTRTQIIGVNGGHLWRADAGDDHPVECGGKNHMELMVNYGFVSLEHDDSNYMEDPLVLIGEDTLLIYERSRAVVEGHFGLASGQRLLLKAPGKYQGYMTTVIGVRDGKLHHFPAGTVGYPVPFEDGDDIGAFLLGSAVLASYPIESSALDSFVSAPVGDYYMGVKVTMPFGYHYRQVLRFNKGPHQGQVGCVMGAGRGQLWAVLSYGETIALGEIKASIDEVHAPTVQGILSCEWTPSRYLSNTAFYPTLGGEPVVLSTADVDLLAVADVSPGMCIMVTGGYRCGEHAEVVGVRKGRLWVQYEGENGGTPIATSSYVPIRNSSSRVDPSLLERGSIHFPALSPCGVVLPISVAAADAFPFGLCHGQCITIEHFDDHEERYLRILSEEAKAHGADGFGEEVLFLSDAVTQGRNARQATRAVVVGVYRHQLWVQREGCAFVSPLRGYSFWELRHHHGNITVLGLSPLAPWSDAFMLVSDLPLMSWTSFDPQYRAEGVIVFTLKTGEPVGLIVDEAHVRPFTPNAVLKQRKLSNFKEDAMGRSPTLSDASEYLQVVGGWDGMIYVTDYVLTENVTRVAIGAIVRPLLDAHRFEMVSSEDLNQQWLINRYGKSASGEVVVPAAEAERGVELFLKQLGVATAPSRNASAGECSALVDDKGRIFQAVPHEVVSRATSFEAPEKLIYTDQGTYNFETMSYRQFIVEFSPLKLGGYTPLSMSADQTTAFSHAFEPVPNRQDTSHQVREETFRIVRRSVFTASSVLAGMFGVLPSWGAPLAQTVEDIAVSMTTCENDSNRAYAAKLLGISGARAFFDEDVLVWKEMVAECVSELLILDLIADGVAIPDSIVAEFRNVHQYFNLTALHGCCAYALSLLGCEEAALLHHYSADECIRMVLAAVQRCTGAPLGVTLTQEEFRAHLVSRLKQVESDELEARAAIEREGSIALDRLAVNPRLTTYKAAFSSSFDHEALDKHAASEGTADLEQWIADGPLEEGGHDASAASASRPPSSKRPTAAVSALPEPWGRIERVRAEIEAMYQASAAVRAKHLSLFGGRGAGGGDADMHQWAQGLADHEALRIQKEGFRFTEADGSVFHLMPASAAFPSYQRGDVVMYTVGDLKGMHATVLGVRDGRLWRCEHSGPFEGRGLPFEGTSEEIIKQRFGAEVQTRAACELKDVTPRLLCGNPSTFLTWTGELKDFDVSYEACFLQYGVVVGQRFQATHQTPDFFPYKHAVLAIVGVLGGRLWFTCDATGAMPFPPEVRKPIYNFRLRLLYSAPIHPPSLRSERFVRMQGSLSEEERRFFQDPGTQTMIFDRTPALLENFHPSLVHGLRAVVTDTRTGKTRRTVIVGVRHGKVWGLSEYDSFATALPASVTYDVVPGDDTLARLATAPLPQPEVVSTRRFPIPQGGLGVFTTVGTSVQYGLDSGTVIAWGGSSRRQTSVVLGLRYGILWRVDLPAEKEAGGGGAVVARPFQGRTTIVSIQELGIEKRGVDADLVALRSW